MKRVNLFLTLLIVSISALIAATIIGFSLFSTQQDPYSWMGQMWGSTSSNNGHGGMMHTPTPISTASSSMLPYYGVLFAVIIAVTIVGVIGIAYYLVYPQIRMGVVSAQPQVTVTQTTTANAGVSAYESVAKTLTEDERKIITVLQTHNGKYLQKYIKAETGLSRLQTHRILARLAERGMVSLEKTGNTNQVVLADWLTQKQ
jgi:predicted transcriptional regulator